MPTSTHRPRPEIARTWATWLSLAFNIQSLLQLLGLWQTWVSVGLGITSAVWAGLSQVAPYLYISLGLLTTLLGLLVSARLRPQTRKTHAVEPQSNDSTSTGSASVSKIAPPGRVDQSQRGPNSELVVQLTDLLADGLTLLENWFDIRSGVMPRGSMTTTEDISEWEAAVARRLKTVRPIHFLTFVKELPPPSMSELSSWPNPDRRRLAYRIQTLERIIVEMGGY